MITGNTELQKDKTQLSKILPPPPDTSTLSALKYKLNNSKKGEKCEKCEFVSIQRVGVLGLRTYGEMPLEIWKVSFSWSQIPENDTISQYKIFKNIALVCECPYNDRQTFRVSVGTYVAIHKSKPHLRSVNGTQLHYSVSYGPLSRSWLSKSEE